MPETDRGWSDRDLVKYGQMAASCLAGPRGTVTTGQISSEFISGVRTYTVNIMVPGLGWIGLSLRAGVP